MSSICEVGGGGREQLKRQPKKTQIEKKSKKKKLKRNLKTAKNLSKNLAYIFNFQPYLARLDINMINVDDAMRVKQIRT